MTDNWGAPEQETEFDLERSSGPLPDGSHEFLLEKIEEKEGPKGLYLSLTLRYNGADPLQTGKVVWHNVSLLPQARWKLDELLDAIGAPKQGKATASKMVGRKLRAVIFQEEYDGVSRSKVSALAPSSGGFAAAAKVTPQPVKAGGFDDVIDSEPAKKSATPASSQKWEDDIPF